MDELRTTDDPKATVPSPASPRGSRSGWRRPVVLAGAGVALSVGLAAGGYGIASATTQSSPLSALASSASAKPSKAPPSRPGPRGWGGAFGGGSHGASAGHGGFGAGLGVPGGVVKSISSNSVTITRPGASAVTVTTNSSTRYREGLVKVSRSALAVGEHVFVFTAITSPVPASGGSATATASTTHAASEIDIILPELSGQVVSVSSSTIVVQDSEGFWRTVSVSSATVYESAGKTTNESSVKKGELVSASGTIESNHTTLKASAVALEGTGNRPVSFPPGAASFGAQGGLGSGSPGPGAVGYGPGVVPQGGSLQ